MAHFAVLTLGERTQIAQGLGPFLPPTLGGASPYKLFESMDVWTIKKEAQIGSAETLKQIASPIDRWHHQIKVDDNAVAYAQSMRSETEPGHVVTSFTQSTLASEIDQALHEIDSIERFTVDAVVHLLTLPSRQLEALWIESPDNDSVVIVKCPFPQLETDRPYAAKEFLEVLRKLPIVVGLKPEERTAV